MQTPRVAIVTGAAQGIGQSTAEVLAQEGYTLVLADLQAPEATIAAVQSAGSQAIAVQGDLSDATIVATIVAAAQAAYGRIDVLVNNAGISSIQPAEAVERATFERVLAVNLVAPFLLSQACFPVMRAQGAGSIVNVASIAGLFGVAERVAYNTSKHGLVGMTRTLAAEWGGLGIRCNAICPGWVKTAMDDADQSRGAYTDADITNRIPMGRFAQPTDIAQGIAYLADPARSGFVNGHALVIDGGWTTDASWESLRLAHRDHDAS
jgi:NAD(P)-dependent dehydrogenase (short-subunit alcohol dehydrogenase family)